MPNEKSSFENRKVYTYANLKERAFSDKVGFEKAVNLTFADAIDLYGAKNPDSPVIAEYRILISKPIPRTEQEDERIYEIQTKEIGISPEEYELKVLETYANQQGLIFRKD